jgi:hypothetical protein
VTDATGDSFDLDLAASTIQTNSGDVHILLKVLVNQLGEALGERLRVERVGGRFKKSDEIKTVEADLGEDVFTAQVSGSSVQCAISHSSGGIRIRSTKVDMDQWLRRLLVALQVEAAHSEVARRALENIVIGGDAQ